MGKVSTAQFDANAAAAMTAFFTRTHIEAVETNTPFLAMMRGEQTSPEVRGRLMALLAKYRALCAAAEASRGKLDVDAVSNFYDAHSDDLMLAESMERATAMSMFRSDTLSIACSASKTTKSTPSAKSVLTYRICDTFPVTMPE